MKRMRPNNQWSTASADTLIDELIKQKFSYNRIPQELLNEIADRLGRLERLER